MKKYFFVLVIISFITGCRTVDRNILNPKDELQNKLPAMRIELNKYLLTNDSTESPASKKLTTMYEQEMSNIFEESGKEYGRVTLKINLVEVNHNYLYMGLTTASCFMLILTGFPADYEETTFEFDFTIRNALDEVVKKYKISCMDGCYYALYWGYDFLEKPSIIFSFSNGLKQVREHIKKDFNKIMANLLETGYYR